MPLFTKGSYPDGKKASTQGLSPIEGAVLRGGRRQEARRQADRVPDHDPDDLQRRHARHPAGPGRRPDKIESWKELLNPKYKGKTALVDMPPVGVMDAAMAIESRGDLKYDDKGNMTKAEIDKTIKILIDLKKGGHFRSFWSTFDQSVNLMASGEVVIQSMWSPAVTAVRTPRHRLLLRAAQGRLSRLVRRPGADEASQRASSSTPPTNT